MPDGSPYFTADLVGRVPIAPIIDIGGEYM